MSDREWQDIESAPNDTFDVLAKHYDASTDMFLMRRFAGCIQVEGRIFWANPFGHNGERVDLIEAGYRPTHWMALPAGSFDVLKP